MTTSRVQSRQESKRKVGKSAIRRNQPDSIISSTVGVSKRTVKNWKKSKISKRKLGSGRKSQLNKVKGSLLRIVRINRHSSVKNITKLLNSSERKNFKPRTVCNWLKKLQVFKKSTVAKPLLLPNHKIQRMKWASEWSTVSDAFLEIVICIDEAGFEINDVPSEIWVLPSDSKQIRFQPKQHRQKRVNLVAAISIHGPIIGLITEENITTALYIKAVENIKKKLRNLGLKGRIHAVHDNAKFHFGAERKFKCMDFTLNNVRQPPYSPDLNPIENAFHLTKQLRSTDSAVFKNLTDLSKAVKRWFSRLPRDVCASLIRSLPSRARAVKLAKGDQTKY